MNFSSFVQNVLKEQFAGEFGMQDTSVDPGTALEVAKILDPTGILSWKDAYDAYQAFVKEQTPFNGLMLAMALGSVIPAARYYVTPVKTAIRSGRSPEAIAKYNQAVSKIKTIYADVQPTLQRHNIDTRTVDKALDLSQQNPNNTFRQLASQIEQNFPAQKIPNVGNMTGDLITRNKKLFIKTVTDIAKKTKAHVDRMNTRFARRVLDPNNPQVKVVDYKVMKGPRQVAELRDEVTGTNFIMYMSSGTGAKEFKKFGEWQTVPGFADADGILWQEPGRVIKDWFIKDDNTIRLTQGGNPFLTQLARFIERNGIQALK